MNVFSRIYQNNAWNGIETRSGPGSHREPTRRVADAILTLVGVFKIGSVTNFGCGEDWWTPELPAYLGVDVAEEAIEAARRNHPFRQYKVWERIDTVPTAEMILCRDVIQHLSLADGTRVLQAILNTGPSWLLASTYVGAENVDIKTGDAYRPNLEAEPFNLPPALLLIHDGYEYHDGDRLRDPGKMLGLWRL